ncbi:MAG TPA: cell division protein FtsZ [Chiayiivirga sp.]|uniref:Cell division protein FtsZ n=1 Tax=Denitratimonas tolerans TaxID=1338420 RepID=A0AAW9R2J2_9GAMM|nr:cell division protein FtsZ [Xanthomonadaceae bacterium]MDX9764080.1 cell division protein FtsZ [Chiayiivirga sp.]MEB2316007.1 cell division protein FtsZ [Xanthomonadaceae bacterium]HRN59791.1 cell division protein FtsZ [Chiayiivirga sp.]HRO86424.1 cell division protein FtsZ [Chiayiivirga sp.]
MAFELVENMTPNAVIKVVGVGGGGGNAVAHMVNSQLEGVEFICANTDAQAIHSAGARHVLQLGSNVTKGLGAGANPEVGRQAALEDRERIVEALGGADMVFITAGMGGGTGTGAAPVVAQLAKEMGILTVAVVTKPFPFEGRRRMQVALKGIEELSNHCDSLITIPNEKLISVLGRDVTMLQAFRAANDVLQGAVRGIADLIVRPGLINVDFADVRTVMSEMGMAMMGSGAARGEERAMEAAEKAVSNPLLDDVNLSGANGILVNITAGPDFAMREFDEVGRTIEAYASEDATVVIGTVLDPDMQDEVRVTVVATGLNRAAARQPLREPEKVPASATRPVRLVRNGSNGAVEYPVPGLGVPHPGAAASVAAPATPAQSRVEAASAAIDYLDIPSFLRRQAD